MMRAEVPIFSGEARPGLAAGLRGIFSAGLVGGVVLSLMETAAVLSQAGAPGGSPVDVLVLATWLAVPYGIALAVAGGAAGAVTWRLAQAPGAVSWRIAPMVAALGIALALWMRTLMRLGEATAARPLVEGLAAAVAFAASMSAGTLLARGATTALGRWVLSGLAGLAAMVVMSRSLPGPFDRPAVPPGLAGRLAWAVGASVAAWLLADLAARVSRGTASRRRVVSGTGAVAAGAWLVFCAADFARTLSPAPGIAAPRGPVSRAAAAGKRPNVVLISIDTLRADHLPAYGYERGSTPVIDDLAREGILFRETASTSSFTTPTHASMMTGLFPSSHGAHYQRSDPSAFVISPMFPDVPTLAEILSAAGYETAGFVSSPMVGSHFGFSRGFEIYDDRCDRLQSVRAQLFGRTRLFRLLARAGVFSSADLDAERRADEVTDLATAWLGSRREARRPFFLFMHYYDPHAPYAAPGDFMPTWGKGMPPVTLDLDLLLRGDYGLTAGATDRVLAHYDAEISYVDHHLGRLRDALRDAGALEDSLIVLTSDHGESFGEHGHWGHNIHLYEDLLQVPLIIRLPGRASAGTRVDDVVAQPTDLLPTVLSILGMQALPTAQGRDLTAFLGDGIARSNGMETARGGSEVLAFSELARNVGWVARWGESLDRDLESVRMGRWKLIASTSGAEELYDLEVDPLETVNLIGEDAFLRDSLRGLLSRWRASQGGDKGGRETDIDEGVIENLRSLGYVQ